ncbi:hypothetical protein [Clostridium beijerinckii]|uniref:hypothetical protein n=1 Tax=Clostridium beijerinckii TaxID=1520 RepID=UPI00156DDA26|nr:hypothetical protein [Clostridium beijerinckii]NRW47037.1 hypothetical protein [Clostridium beijerinckii]
MDSDLYFYSNPQILFDEIKRANADVVITEHRFRNNKKGRQLEKRSGKYCVQFNYFCQTQNSRKVLKWWRDKCHEWCYYISEPDRMGDQKYLNNWTRDFEGVHELQHLGGGVAPWNLDQYVLSNNEKGQITMKTNDGHPFKLVFYHFQNIRYLPNRKVNIKSEIRDKKLKYNIYIPYLKEIEEIRGSLFKNYRLSFDPKKLQRSSNPIIGFLQSRFAAFKVKSFSDILDLDNLDKYK